MSTEDGKRKRKRRCRCSWCKDGRQRKMRPERLNAKARRELDDWRFRKVDEGIDE